MEFNQQENVQNSIVSIEDGCVQLSHTQIEIPCFISTGFYSKVDITSLEQIDKPLLFPLSTQDDIDVLLIGTGTTPKFLHPKQQVMMQQMGIGVESMNSESACRSFNLLLSDARSVGLLLP